MKAIETRYAGCRFRSRLEARWAVFLDHLGYKWEYEPQGFNLTGPEGQKISYLPDFWLPEVTTWVEVKGTGFEGLTEDDFLKCLTFAKHAWVQGQRFRILSDIPRRPDLVLEVPVIRAWTLTSLPSGLFAGEPRFVPPEVTGMPCTMLEFPGGVTDEFNGKQVTVGDLSGTPCWIDAAWLPGGDIASALTAARSARFEHGERGA